MGPGEDVKDPGMSHINVKQVEQGRNAKHKSTTNEMQSPLMKETTSNIAGSS